MNNLRREFEKRERKRELFQSRLALFMSCLKYVTDRIKTRYNYFDIIKELGTIELDYRLEYIKVKLYEMMLMMSETDKGKIFYNEDKTSEELFSLYQANNRYFKDSLVQLKETVDKIHLIEREESAERANGHHDSYRQSA